MDSLLKGKDETVSSAKSEGQKVISDAILRAEKLLSEVEDLKKENAALKLNISKKDSEMRASAEKFDARLRALENRLSNWFSVCHAVQRTLLEKASVNILFGSDRFLRNDKIVNKLLK